MLKPPSPNVSTETHTVYLAYKTKLYKNLMVRGYRIKLQHWEYMERRTPDNVIYEKNLTH